MKLANIHKTLIISLVFITGVSAFALERIWEVFAFLLLGSLYCIWRKYFSQKFLMVGIITFLVAVFYTGLHTPEPDDFSKHINSYATISAKVISTPSFKWAYKGGFELEPTEVCIKGQCQSTSGKTFLNIYDDERLQRFKQVRIGDTIVFKSKIKQPHRAVNPGQFDYADYLEKQGIFSIMYTNYQDILEINKPKENGWRFLQSVNSLRDSAVALHQKNLAHPKGDILSGIVFGSTAAPPPQEQKEEFINSGLYHLLAASGMNVGIIWFIWFVFGSRVLRLPHKPIIVIGMLLVAIYMIMTAFPPSVLRAGIIIEFVLLGKLIDRQSNNLILLALVGALLLLFNPYMIFDVGFQMSFIVTFGLLFCLPILNKKTENIPQAISTAVFAPLIAQVWVMPIQIFHFNSFIMYSLLANVLAVPFFGIISGGGFAGSLISFIPFGEKICFLIDKIIDPFLSLMLFTAKYFSSLPNALMHYKTPTLASIILFYGALICLAFCIKKDFQLKKLNRLAIILFVALGLSYIDFSRKTKMVIFKDPKGSAVFIQTPKKENILINGGMAGKYSTAKTSITPYFYDIGVKKLDAIIFTSNDIDISGGAFDIMENFRVEKIYNAESNERLSVYSEKNKIELITLKKLEIERLVRGFLK